MTTLRALLCVLVLASLGLTQNSPATLAEGQRLLQAGDMAGAATELAAVTQNEPTNAAAWWLHGYALHAQGQFEEALVSHAKAAEFPAIEANASYNAACASARLGEADQALEWLARARTAGFNNRALISTDTDLDSLRALPEFANLVPPLRTGADAFVEPVRVLLERHGEAAGDQYGWVARSIGDVDGDGALDFITSAPSAKGGAGMVEAVSSKTNERLYAHVGPPNASLGNGLGPAGDVDGDGVPDAIVGAPFLGSNAPGMAFVYSGKDGAVIWSATGEQAASAFGSQVIGLGDLDGDGHGDVAVSATQFDGSAGANCGAVDILSGADGTRLQRIEGSAAGALFGSAVAASFDEHRMLVVGAQGSAGGGRVHVFKVGADRADELFTIDPGPNSASLGQYFVSVPGDIDDDGTPDVYASDFGDATNGPATGQIVVHSGATGERLLTLNGSQPGEGFGTSPSDAGDVDGDGAADLIVGAWQHASAAPSGGRCTLHSGQDGSVLATYTCQELNDTFGFDAVGIGDVDGDGGIDFLITSAWADAKGPRTGRVFIVAGPTPTR